jgi:hypothetical protein
MPFWLVWSVLAKAAVLPAHSISGLLSINFLLLFAEVCADVSLASRLLRCFPLLALSLRACVLGVESLCRSFDPLPFFGGGSRPGMNGSRHRSRL